MTFLKAVSDEEAAGEVADIYRRQRGGVRLPRPESRVP